MFLADLIIDTLLTTITTSIEGQARGSIYRIGQEEETTIVSLTAERTIDERMKGIVTHKIANIGKVEQLSKTKTLKALLKMFNKAKKNNDIVGLDSEDD